MPVLIADVGYRKHRTIPQLALNPDAVLITRRILVIGVSKTGNVGNGNGCGQGLASEQAEVRIGERNIIKRHAGAKRNIWTRIVYVIALDALVHNTEAAPQNRLARACKVISKTK